MADAGPFVYGCARDAHEQITRLSDFVSPTIVAMWNLRWQVQGFLQVRPEATQEDIIQRFASGSETKGNEIKRACVEVSWEEQQLRFSLILLTNTIAIFEECLEAMVKLTVTGEDKRRRVVKALQFPVATSGRNYTTAYDLMTSKSAELSGAFTSGISLSRWYGGSKIQNLLLCYRFFKEARNCWIHNGGKASSALMEAHTLFSPVATKVALGMREVPRHSVPTLDTRYPVDLRSSYAFSDVVLRLITTYDRDLSDRSGALIEITRRLRSIKASDRTHMISAERKQKLIEGLFRNSQIPAPTITPAFKQFLKSIDKIPDFW